MCGNYHREAERRCGCTSGPNNTGNLRWGNKEATEEEAVSLPADQLYQKKTQMDITLILQQAGTNVSWTEAEAVYCQSTS